MVCSAKWELFIGSISIFNIAITEIVLSPSSSKAHMLMVNGQLRQPASESPRINTGGSEGVVLNLWMKNATVSDARVTLPEGGM